MHTITHRLQRAVFSRWFTWGLFGSAILVVLGIIIAQSVINQHIPTLSQVLIWCLIIFGIGLLTLMIIRVVDLYEQRAKLVWLVAESDRQNRTAFQRLEAIFQLGQQYAEADDEQSIVALLLHRAVDLAEGRGASFVPLDEHKQPLAAIRYGELPAAVLDPWLEYLASPAIRQRCNTCAAHEQLSNSCPLLQGPTESNGVYCLPIQHGTHEFGILALYMRDASSIDQQTRAFLGALVEETAMALDSLRLRQKELATIRQLQTARQKPDINAMLNSLLESLADTLEVDFAIFSLNPSNKSTFSSISAFGEIPEKSSPFIEGIIQGVITSGLLFTLGEVASSPDSDVGVRSLACVPVYGEEGNTIGALSAGRNHQQHFTQRETALMQAVAGQMGFLIENIARLNAVEYRAMMEERKRLAREIHDSLAQTLGFLKLQAAQMRNYMSREDYGRVSKGLDTFYSTLSEAYLEAREAIDGLRMGLGEGNLANWLEEIVREFDISSNYTIHLRQVDIPDDLPLEVQGQMIRIIQEALSNIRKHAGAEQVWIDCFEHDDDLHLIIQDDGVGFTPKDISETSRHGLRGMRERSDLIGADFQVISGSDEGTIVKIRLPLQTIRREEGMIE